MVNIGSVETFPDVEPTKEQALKVLEEAAEVFGAWQIYEPFHNDTLYKLDVIDEIADVIMASCNLLSALGVDDAVPFIDACVERNRARGRYDA